MPKIDRTEYMGAEAKQGGGGGYTQMEPGVYELYIQAVRTEKSKYAWNIMRGKIVELYEQTK